MTGMAPAGPGHSMPATCCRGPCMASGWYYGVDLGLSDRPETGSVGKGR